jgi:hypothetical protein
MTSVVKPQPKSEQKPKWQKRIYDTLQRHILPPLAEIVLSFIPYHLIREHGVSQWVARHSCGRTISHGHYTALSIMPSYDRTILWTGHKLSSVLKLDIKNWRSQWRTAKNHGKYKPTQSSPTFERHYESPASPSTPENTVYSTLTQRVEADKRTKYIYGQQYGPHLFDDLRMSLGFHIPIFDRISSKALNEIYPNHIALITIRDITTTYLLLMPISYWREMMHEIEAIERDIRHEMGDKIEFAM